MTFTPFAIRLIVVLPAYRLFGDFEIYANRDKVRLGVIRPSLNSSRLLGDGRSKARLTLFVNFANKASHLNCGECTMAKVTFLAPSHFRHSKLIRDVEYCLGAKSNIDMWGVPRPPSARWWGFLNSGDGELRRPGLRF